MIILKRLERRFSAEEFSRSYERIRQATGRVQQQALVELTKEGEDLDLKLISQMTNTLHSNATKDNEYVVDIKVLSSQQ